jgi:hypothetical protein
MPSNAISRVWKRFRTQSVDGKIRALAATLRNLSRLAAPLVGHADIACCQRAGPHRGLTKSIRRKEDEPAGSKPVGSRGQGIAAAHRRSPNASRYAGLHHGLPTLTSAVAANGVRSRRSRTGARLSAASKIGPEGFSIGHIRLRTCLDLNRGMT